VTGDRAQQPLRRAAAPDEVRGAAHRRGSR
jgi:hypothetical protein